MVLHPNAGTDWKQKEKMKWLDGISDSVGMHQSKLWEIVKDREAWCAACSPRGRKQTWLSDWTTANTHSTAMKARESNFLRKKKNKNNFAVVQDLQKLAQLGAGLFSFQDVGWEIFSAWYRHFSLLMESDLNDQYSSQCPYFPCTNCPLQLIFNIWLEDAGEKERLKLNQVA